MGNRQRLRKWLSGGTLCLLAGTLPAQLSAQSGSATRKHVGDPAAAGLNRLLVDAQQAVNNKDYASAAKNYQDYLAKKPDDAQVHFNLGYAYTAMQRPADARLEYEKAIALDPEMTPAYLNLGILLLGSDSKAAAKALEKASELLPDDAHTKFLLGVALERGGKSVEAIEQYQAAANLDAKNPEIQDALGHALLGAGRASDAEAAFHEALALNPEGSEEALAQAGLAQALMAQKKTAEAAAAFAAYLETRPDDAGVRRERAFALADLGRNDEALAELDRAAGGGPEELSVLKLRAQLYFAKKDYANWIAALQKAEALAPREADLSAALGHAYLEKKDYTDAAPELVKAYNLNAGDVSVLADLVGAEYELKNYVGTLQALDEMAKHQELPASAWFVRASCYDKLAQRMEALDAYKMFLQMNKDEASDMYFAATARVRALPREIREKGK